MFVSTFERSISWSWEGIDPTFTEGAESTEWETAALANQATTAGWMTGLRDYKCFHAMLDLTKIIKPAKNKKNKRLNQYLDFWFKITLLSNSLILTHLWGKYRTYIKYNNS